jgi:hypothetical protein
VGRCAREPEPFREIRLIEIKQEDWIGKQIAMFMQPTDKLRLHVV